MEIDEVDHCRKERIVTKIVLSISQNLCHGYNIRNTHLEERIFREGFEKCLLVQ